MEYEAIIGLEVHAQLKTESKMFCRCSTTYSDAPENTHVCQVCMALPGVLPTINKKAVECTMMTALALNCEVSELTKFDRKNYHYPDLMKGYQISQFDKPIGLGGYLEFEVDGEQVKAGITRVHLEEDVAKLHHKTENGESFSLVDINRSGVPLMEVVGEPDLRTPEEARQYLIKLRSILRYLGVSTANMEEGSFRCDANISLRKKGETKLNPKVEVKNMNSFRAVFGALEYEIKRQTKLFDKGELPAQETRGWVDDKCITVSQRSKEFAHDYRYFPEPDLPPLNISRDWVEEVKAKLPELPNQKIERFMGEYGLPAYDANLLASTKEMADYYEAAVNVRGEVKHKDISNWVLGSVSGILNSNSCDIIKFAEKVSSGGLIGLLELNAKGTINTATAKSVLEDMFASGKSAEQIVKEKGLSQISDSGEMEEIAAGIIRANPQAVKDFNDGKEQAVKFLVGQMMKATRGRANPNAAYEIIKKKLVEG